MQHITKHKRALRFLALLLILTLVLPAFGQGRALANDSEGTLSSDHTDSVVTEANPGGENADSKVEAAESSEAGAESDNENSGLGNADVDSADREADSQSVSVDIIEALSEDSEDPQVDATISVDIIAAKNGYDGWEILYPKTVSGSTKLELPVSDETPPTLYDAMMKIDSSVTLRANGRIDTLFGLASGNDNTWFGYIDSSRKNTPNTANLNNGDKIIFYYYDGMATRPGWDELAVLIKTPNPARTPSERLEYLLSTELTFDKIKGNNTSANSITANLGTLPSRLDANAMSQANFNVTWTSSDTSYISNTGAIQARPPYGKEPAPVIMTATVTAGSAYSADKYGLPEDAGLPRTVQISLAVAPLTEEEENTNITSVRAALDGILLENLKLMDGDALNPQNVLYDIQLVDPRGYGDKTTEYLSDGYWTSSNPDVISVNWMRGKVTRPAVGEADETVVLTVRAVKGGYEESKQLTVTVKAVTGDELNAANAELDAVAAALTFDVIKNANTSADAVTGDLQLVYRGLDYPGQITWGSGRGEKGVKIEWSRSDGSLIPGSITRPSSADQRLTLTAALTPYRLASHLQPRAVEIPIVARKVSTSANVAAISLSPSMGFIFSAAVKSYDLTAPAIADSVTITVTAEETGALITSGEHSARETLTFTVALNGGQTAAVSINTKALDSDNTDTYTINIARGTADATEAAVLELLASISHSYKNTSGDWAAMDMAAYGMADDVAGADIVKNTRGAYATGGTTDIARSIITLTALGVDASNVYSGNEGVYLNFIAKLGESAPSQTMEAIFGLLALDSGEYDDSGLALTRRSCVDFLLNKKLTPAAGQTAWSWGSGPDADTTAMALAALAPYYNSNTNVKTAIDGALSYLSAAQGDSGHYGNSNSTSMVIVAISALSKDPNANTGDFSKGGKSLIDGLLSFTTGSNQFGYTDNTTANPLSTEQGFRALVAYRGFQYAGNSAYNIYHFGAQTGDGTELTGESDPSVTPPDPGAPKNITVRVENLYNGVTLMPETSVKLSGTHLDALKAALEANGHNPDTDLTEASGYVSAILGVGSGSTTGWMYAINGEIPVTMLSETQIAEGDSLILFFIDWYDSFFFTMFDKTTASVKTGASVTLTLTGINPWDAMGSGGVYAPISGADVYARDTSGNQIGTSVVTGADGKATLAFSSAGTYVISAARQGAINATDLVPPLCAVTVTSSGAPSNPDPDDTIMVYFTLRGLNSSSGNEETWISGKTISIANGATVSDVIIEALDGTGYTQNGAQNGYLKSVTTPGGFTLSEMYNGMPNSGWLYKVNSQLPNLSMDSYIVKNSDQVLLCFTKDFTNDPNAGNISGGAYGTGIAEASVVSSQVEVTAVVKEGVAIAAVDSDIIKDALKDALDSLAKSSEADAAAEVKVSVIGMETASAARVEIKAGDIKAIADAKIVLLTIECGIAALTFNAETLAGISDGVADDSVIKFVFESVDTAALDSENQKIAGDSPVFYLSVMIGETAIHDFEGTVTVFLPFTPTEGADPEIFTVYCLSEGGNAVPMEDVYYDAKRKGFIFTTTRFSLFFIGAANDEWADSFADAPEAYENPFTDIMESDWYYDAVKYANINNLMTGTSADKFSPNTPMTRAMLVTLLYRREGEPAVTAANSFADADDGQWYTSAVIWAYENGVVTGYDNGLFGTNDNVTREQTVTILRNYAQKKGLNVSKTTDLSAYTDIGEISFWALNSMKWANAEGLLSGRSATTLAPKGTATRAEVASIFMSFMENVVQ